MTVFRTWQFPATGVTTGAKRTMADRLSDVINVKDWGAVGNNSTDDSAAIQAAIDYCISTKSNGSKGGIVFFPSGSYFLGTSPLTCGSSDPDIGVVFQGTGHGTSSMRSTYGSGFVLSKGAATYDCIARVEGLGITNNSTAAGTGAIKVTRNAVAIWDGNHTGIIGIDASRATGCSVISCVGGLPGFSANTTTPGPTPGSIALCIGSNGYVAGCRWNGGYFIGVAVGGPDISTPAYGTVIDCISTETLGNGIRVGWGPGGESPSYGCSIFSFQTERTFYSGVDLYNATACLVTGSILTAHAGMPVGQNILDMSWNSGSHVVTVTTATDHHIPVGVGGRPRLISFEGTNAFTPKRYIFVTVTGGDTTHFTFAGPVSDPGSYSANSITWNYAPWYSIRCRKVYESAILANNAATQAGLGSIDLDYDGEADHRNNILSCTDIPQGIILPTTRGNLASWNFEHCYTDLSGANQAVFDQALGNPVPNAVGQMVFADLPDGTPQSGPYEGQEYSISDGQKSGGGAAVFADIVSGGSSGHYKVRYDGTNWRRVG